MYPCAGQVEHPETELELEGQAAGVRLGLGPGPNLEEVQNIFQTLVAGIQHKASHNHDAVFRNPISGCCFNKPGLFLRVLLDRMCEHV